MSGYRSLRLLVTVVVAVFLASGCAPDTATPPPPPSAVTGQPPPPPAPAPVPVPEDVLIEVLAAFVTDKNLRFGAAANEGKLARHKGTFVRRRTQYIGARNSAWLTGAGRTTLRDRVRSEYTEVEAYLNQKLGTTAAPGPLGGLSTPAPSHLDLAAVAKPKSNTSAGGVRRNKGNYLALRRYRVAAIVWRACALHDDLWQPSADKRTATLNREALDEVLDRRLRSIERLNLEISDASELGGRSWQGGATANPATWKDGFIIRMFEYPRLPRSFEGIVGTANIASETDTAYTGGKPWRWLNARHSRMGYNIPPRGGKLVEQPAQWQAGVDSYERWLGPSGGRTAASVVDQLFQPADNWGGRNWAFCDHVVSALHIEALLLGLRRRPAPKGGEAVFNTIVTGHGAGYVRLTAPVRAFPPDPDAAGVYDLEKGADFNCLLADGADDPFFENRNTYEQDLEIGDHLLFWNSYLYRAVASEEWQLENSLVMDVDCNPDTGALFRNRLLLQGHGIGVRQYASYQDGVMAQLRPAVTAIQDRIKTVIAVNAAATTIRWEGIDERVIRWEPYQPFQSPGSWWVRIEVDEVLRASELVHPDGSALTNLEKETKAQGAVPGSFRSDELAKSTPLAAPLKQGNIYFPVFEPKFGFDHAAHASAWEAYLAERAAGRIPRVPKKLGLVELGGRLAPGMYRRGLNLPIPVIRPRVRP